MFHFLKVFRCTNVTLAILWWNYSSSEQRNGAKEWNFSRKYKTMIPLSKQWSFFINWQLKREGCVLICMINQYWWLIWKHGQQICWFDWNGGQIFTFKRVGGFLHNVDWVGSMAVGIYIHIYIYIYIYTYIYIYIQKDGGFSPQCGLGG